MALRRQSSQRVYIEDDIPTFMKAGPSKLVLNEARKHGLMSKHLPRLTSTPSDAPIPTSAEKQEEPIPVKETYVLAPPPILSHSKGWDQRFLLTVVTTLVLLNTALFIGFKHGRGSDGKRLMLINRATEEAPSSTRLEDRIITYRQPNPKAIESAKTQDALEDTIQDTASYQYSPMMP